MQISRIKRIQNATRRMLNHPTRKCQGCNVDPASKHDLVKTTRAAVKREFAASINRQLMEMQPDYDEEFPLIEIPKTRGVDEYDPDPEIPYAYRWQHGINDTVGAALVRAFTNALNDE